MRIGLVREVASAGDRVLVAAEVDGGLERDLVLVCPGNLRLRVVVGPRVIVFAHAGNDVQRFALPFELATQSADVVAHRGAVMITLADGLVTIAAPTVRVVSDGGTASPVATLADLQALRDYVAGHTHPVIGGGGGTAAAPTVPPGQPSGTQVLEAE
jgi:hypothetical protein